MEDRSRILQNSGIANARKISVVSLENSDTQSVLVRDGFGEVHLSLQSSSFPAGLTPEQARLLARQILASAKRVELKEPSP